MSLVSIASREAACRSLFGNDATQTVYEKSGTFVAPNTKPPTTWYLGLVRSKSSTDGTPVNVESIGKAAVPNTDEYWDFTSGVARNKKKIVFQGTMTGLPTDDYAYIIGVGLYDADSTTAELWMTGQPFPGPVKIKNNEGFAADVSSLIFSPDVTVQI